MRYRKLDPLGDYSFGHSAQDFYRDEPAAVGQAALTRLLLWLGEWFLDTEAGTLYLQGILGKYSTDLADTTVQTRLTDTLNLTGIAFFASQLDPVTRAYSFQANLDTAFGPTEIQKANYATY